MADRPAPPVENPITLGHVRRLFGIPTPSQTIRPWQIRSPREQATCPWLKGLPRPVPTSFVAGREARVRREPPGPERWRNRSRTYPGIAAAMRAAEAFPGFQRIFRSHLAGSPMARSFATR
jgi:hypothetical protein